MASQLPNELIREILYPSFHVPDEMLHDVSDISPFFRPSYQPCSVILLVCKRWMMVGTSLLYEVVVLRSKAQAYAFERTFRKNKDLGTLVRKLRVEGGYGAAMRTIITLSPNIRDLGISFDLRSSDSVKGLLSSLSTINPTSLVILDPMRKDGKVNAPLRQLSNKLIACFQAWSNLNQVFLPQTYYRYPFQHITNALAGATNLQTIVISGRAALSTVRTMEILAENLTLKDIRLTFLEDDYLSSTISRDLENMCARPRLRGLITYEKVLEKSPSCIPRSSDPLYTPLENVSKELYDTIWGRILQFAMHVDPYPYKFPSDDTSFLVLSYTHKYVPMVSKAFRRLSLPHKYRSAVCYGSIDMQRYTGGLKSDPSRWSQLESITFWPSTWAFGSETVLQKCIEDIISQASNLTSISSAFPIHPGRKMFNFESPLSIRWSGIETLANVSGPNIVYLLDIKVPATPFSRRPTVLSRFSALRELSCTVDVAFDTAVPVAPEWLPRLEVLKLRACHSSFFDVLSNLSLPALRHLDITSFHKELPQVTNFLEKHGPKILTLEIEHHGLSVPDMCPNMTQLTLIAPRYRNEEYGLPDIEDKHECVSKITFIPDCDDILSRIFSPPDLDLITDVDYSFFPALKEIQVSTIEWPPTEYEILKNVWPGCAEVLASYGIKLTDRKGIAWRPRLKYSRT